MFRILIYAIPTFWNYFIDFSSFKMAKRNWTKDFQKSSGCANKYFYSFNLLTLIVMCDRRERITVEHFFKYCQKLRSIIQNIYANVWGFLGHNGEDPIIIAALLIIFSHSCWQVVWCLCHGSYLSISQHSRVKLSVLRLWNDYDSNRSCTMQVEKLGLNFLPKLYLHVYLWIWLWL